MNSAVSPADFGPTLRQRRHSLGLSAADVAAAVGMTLERLDAIESNQPATEAQQQAIGLALERLAVRASQAAKEPTPAPTVLESSRHTCECVCAHCERNQTGLYAQLAALRGDRAAFAKLGRKVAEAIPSLRRGRGAA